MRYWSRPSTVALLLLVVTPVVGNRALHAGYLPITSLRCSGERLFSPPLLLGGMEPLQVETEWTTSDTWVSSRSEDDVRPDFGRMYTYRLAQPLHVAWGSQGHGAGSGPTTSNPGGDSSTAKAGSFGHVNLPPPGAVGVLEAEREATLPSSIKSRLFRPPRRGCAPHWFSVG